MNFPHITIYTDNLPEDVGGDARLFIVRIKNKYRDDAGIHRHEYTHVNQFWAMLILFITLVCLTVYICDYDQSYLALSLFGISFHALLYITIKDYRLYCEASAYAAQTMPDKSDLDVMARRLTSYRYNLGLSVSDAKWEIERLL